MFTPHQIETITQSVLRELASRGVVVAARPSLNGVSRNGVPNVVHEATNPGDSVKAINGSRSSFRAGDSSPRPLPSETVLVTDKIVTEDSLMAIAAAGGSVSLPAEAIVTPSGRDYLRRNQITIVSENDSPDQTNKQQSNQLGSVIVVGTALAAVTAAQTAQWKSLKADSEFQAAAQARTLLPNPVVCVVPEPSVTACLLNRNSAVRAAVVTTKTNIATTHSIMKPQVVCLNSLGWSVAALLSLFRTLTHIEPASPAGWKEIE